MNTITRSPSTLLEAVRASLAHAARYNPGDMVAPAAVLWTDADGQWRPVVEQLRPLMPELLTLGDYDAATRTGPAIWLRCVIEPAVRADKFPDLAWPADTVPRDLHAGREPADAPGGRGMPGLAQAAGRASVPRDSLDAEER